MQVDTALLLLLLLLLLPFDDDIVDAAALSTRWLIAPTPSNPISTDPQLYVSPAWPMW